MPPNGITGNCYYVESCAKPNGISSKCVDILTDIGSVTLYENWELQNGFTLESDQFGNVNLNFTVFNKNISDDVEWVSENFGYLSQNLRPIESVNFNDENTDITILNDGNIYYMSDNPDFSKGYLSISLNLKYKINGI